MGSLLRRLEYCYTEIDHKRHQNEKSAIDPGSNYHHDSAWRLCYARGSGSNRAGTNAIYTGRGSQDFSTRANLYWKICGNLPE
jgi:hypothetical protein